MPKVFRRDEEELDSLLRRWKRQVNDANILGECKKHEFYMSKSERLREKSKAAAAKARKVRR